MAGLTNDRWQSGPSFRPGKGPSPVKQSYPAPSSRPPTKVAPSKGALKSPTGTPSRGSMRPSRGGSPVHSTTPSRYGTRPQGSPTYSRVSHQGSQRYSTYGAPPGPRPYGSHGSYGSQQPYGVDNTPNRAPPRPSGKVKSTPLRPESRPPQGGHKSQPPRQNTTPKSYRETKGSRYDDRNDDRYSRDDRRYDNRNGGRSVTPPYRRKDQLNRMMPYRDDDRDRDRDRNRDRRRYTKVVKCVDLTDSSYIAPPLY
eukprot:TRINITY_DN11755_c0_g3_i1.p1 TRINITY_DN11755_c0_g3~~TRINITY_DN11755_c0_g3_i1.p1  ORF type:complete len:278 (+),score=29.63 TRINITY_DN11755_c0_g3_i1:75-836(+)